MNVYPVILFPRTDLQTSIDLNKRYPCEVGLTNQLFALVSGLIRAARSLKRYVVIDSLLADAIQGIPIHVSRVLDLSKTQANLRRIRGFERIELRDRAFVNADLSRIFSRAKFQMSWYTQYERFNDILLSIEYVEGLHKLSRELSPAQDSSPVHLRIEDDMITHLSRYHHLDWNYVKNTLISKYWQAISQYIPAGSTLFIMGAPGFSQLTNSYRLYNLNHIKPNLIQATLGISGRELSAIVDYLIARELKGVLVGSHRLATSSGSTFSYYLLISLRHRGRVVLVDPDNLENGLEVH